MKQTIQEKILCGLFLAISTSVLLVALYYFVKAIVGFDNQLVNQLTLNRAAVAVEAKLVFNRHKLFCVKIMKQKQKHKEPVEIQDENPTLEDLRRELSIYDDEPLDDGPGWDIGKDESL